MKGFKIIILYDGFKFRLEKLHRKHTVNLKEYLIH